MGAMVSKTENTAALSVVVVEGGSSGKATVSRESEMQYLDAVSKATE